MGIIYFCSNVISVILVTEAHDLCVVYVLLWMLSSCLYAAARLNNAPKEFLKSTYKGPFTGEIGWK